MIQGLPEIFNIYQNSVLEDSISAAAMLPPMNMMDALGILYRIKGLLPDLVVCFQAGAGGGGGWEERASFHRRGSGEERITSENTMGS